MARKLTALEWLMCQMIQAEYHSASPTMCFVIPNDALTKAKAMEKEQIIQAHGIKTKKSAGVENYIYTLTGEQYYTKTYETDEQGTD